MQTAPPLTLFSSPDGTSFFFSSGSLMFFASSKEGGLTLVHAKTPSWVRCATVSPDGLFLAVATHCKTIQTYQITDTLTLQSSIEANKRVTCITYTTDGNILYGDKSGRAYQWNKAQQAKAKELLGKAEFDLSDEEKAAIKPTLMLGHCSLITDMIFDAANGRLLTSDQDYKIRVNSYPKYYNIENYMLGHSEYVSGMKFFGDRVVSGSGDGTGRLWESGTGKELKCIELPSVNESKPASRALLFSKDRILFSRGSILSVLSEELEIKEQIDCGSQILAVCAVGDILLCSVFDSPYFLLFDGNYKVVSSDNKWATTLASGLEQTAEETYKEIKEELSNLQERRSDNIRQSKRKRRKLEDEKEVAVLDTE